MDSTEHTGDCNGGVKYFYLKKENAKLWGMLLDLEEGRKYEREVGYIHQVSS